MPDHAATSQQPLVSSDRVLEILQRDPMGAALLRAAIAEATCEVLQRQLEDAKKQDSGQEDPRLRH